MATVITRYKIKERQTADELLQNDQVEKACIDHTDSQSNPS